MLSIETFKLPHISLKCDVLLSWIQIGLAILANHSVTHDMTLKNVYCCCSRLLFGRVQLFRTLWTVAHCLLCPWDFQVKEYWSGLPILSPGDLPRPGIEPASPALQADSLSLSHRESKCPYPLIYLLSRNLKKSEIQSLWTKCLWEY